MTSANAAIVSGFDTSTLARNDDDSTGPVDIGFDFNFYGQTYNQLYVNNNGNVTFTAPLDSYSPFGLSGATSLPIIAPFFVDVDTLVSGSGVVSYGQGTYDGYNAFGVTYPGVAAYGGSSSKLDTFQLILVQRSDIAAGDVDIVFNYGSMQFDLGVASYGNAAHVGFSNGSGVPGTFFELTGSGIANAFVDGGPDALNGTTVVTQERAGVVETPTTQVPEPTGFALLGIGLAGLLASRRKRAQ